MLRALGQGKSAPIPRFIEHGGGVAPVRPGRTGTVPQVLASGVVLDRRAGRYAVVYFIQDRMGDEPHVATGMIREVRVSP